MKNELLHNFVEVLNGNGFRCYALANEEDYSYVFFEKDDKIGYVQNDYFGGLKFSTVHKPCRECGTGFGLQENGIYEPTIENAIEAFQNTPVGFGSYAKYVKKYKNWDERTQKNTILKYKQV